ncbi:CgeB family protein [Flaviflagellibacter deserti]|uniref:Glycosyltransferase n=1 Tax=Flaviflagellibacter deserti TaxID=2267266 RepID=A0ABV9Z1M3_9HYPH
MTTPLRIVFLGLSITSSWGNGHATTYRSLIRGLHSLGHDVLFLERDVPWYADHRDLPRPEYCELGLYNDRGDLIRWDSEIARADAVILGSYVPDGVAIADYVLDTACGVTAFYDIDTPVTLAKLMRGEEEYVSRTAIPRFDLYLSFTGGPTLRRLEQEFGAQRAEALYCSVDEERYRPADEPANWDLGYLGTYSDDRQPTLERLLLEPARKLPDRRFVVAGPQYPSTIAWPANVDRIEHLPPERHPEFYSRQRYTLNVTRADMIAAGWSPSVRLFEAAACGTPIISDYWPGLDELLPAGEAAIIAAGAEDVVRAITGNTDAERVRLAINARSRILQSHTGRARAAELASCLTEARSAAGRRLSSVRVKELDESLASID